MSAPKAFHHAPAGMRPPPLERRLFNRLDAEVPAAGSADPIPELLAGKYARTPLPIDELIGVVARVAAGWMRPDDSFRLRALEWMPLSTGLSPEVIAVGLDAVFGLLTREGIAQWLCEEFGSPVMPNGPRVLDGPDGGRRVRTPRLIRHTLAGVIPYPTVITMVCGLFCRAVNVVKSSSADPVFPALFAESVEAADPRLHGAFLVSPTPVPISRFERDNPGACLVVAYGSDQTIADIRAGASGGTRFLGHPHRFSIGVITGDADLSAAADAAATDVCLYDLLGCLSPAAFFVQGRAAEFAEQLAGALERKTAALPPGERTQADRIAIRRSRDAAEFAQIGGKGVTLSASGDLRWTIAVFDTPDRAVAPLDRIVNIVGVDRIEQIGEFLGPSAGRLSAAGLATGGGASAQALADAMIGLGARRICPLGRMQTPPLAWRHDGRFHLADFVEWVDWEG